MRALSVLSFLALAAPVGAADISVQRPGEFTASLKPANRAVIEREAFEDGSGALIVVSGPFSAGDDRALARALLETQGKAVVLFESPGGSLLAGLAMGRAVRLQEATTVVEAGATCASACGLAWLGGARKMMGEGARVGFHAAYYTDDQGRQIETGQGNALIGAYLNQLGLSDKAVMYITAAAPADMTWLSPDDAGDLGIPVRILRPPPPPPPAPVAPAPAPVLVPPDRLFPQPVAPAPAPAPPQGQAGWQVVHNAPAGYMNIRSGPGIHHPVIFTLAPSAPVALEGCRQADPGGGSSQWCLISGAGRQGWISRIGLEPEGTTTVADDLPGRWQIVHNAPAGYMNVRAGPGVGYPVLFTLAPALAVGVESCRQVEGGAGVWCRIASGGQAGWITRAGLEPEGTRAQAGASWRVPSGVSGGYANVRSGAGIMHDVLFTIPAGATGLRVERCRPSDPGGGRFDWCLVLWQGQSGWVSRNGIEPG